MVVVLTQFLPNLEIKPAWYRDVDTTYLKVNVRILCIQHIKVDVKNIIKIYEAGRGLGITNNNNVRDSLRLYLSHNGLKVLGLQNLTCTSSYCLDFIHT